MLIAIRSALVFGCLILSSLHAAVASPWKPMMLPKNVSGALRGIHFLNEKTGWIVGDKGLCLATADGGATWTTLNTETDATLRAVWFKDENTGYICGDGDSKAPDARGHVVMLRAMKCASLLSTTDGGKTWKKNWVPCNFEVWCLEASTAPAIQVGVGTEDHLDGDITRSGDNGASWTERRVFRALAAIRMVDGARWVAVGSPVSVGFSGTINDPCYTAKECRALVSKDAGKTWTPSTGSDGSTVLRGVVAGKKDAPLIAVGDGGAILSSIDGGDNWSALKNTETSNLRAIAATAERGAIVAAGERGTFLLSADGGKTWRASHVGKAVQLYAVAAVGGNFLAVGDDGAAYQCSAADLLGAKELPAPFAPPPVAAKPVKIPTAAQRARVKVGDFVIYSNELTAPALGMNTKFKEKATVTAVQGDEFTVVSEIVEGAPPPGAPKRSEAKGAIADLEDYSAFVKGETKDIKQGAMNVKQKRLEDEAAEVGGKKLECIVVETSLELPGGSGSAKAKLLMSASVPISGAVKLESTQIMNMPGGAKATIVRKQDLVDWGNTSAKK